jgi:hypothetical protein
MALREKSLRAIAVLSSVEGLDWEGGADCPAPGALLVLMKHSMKKMVFVAGLVTAALCGSVLIARMASFLVLKALSPIPRSFHRLSVLEPDIPG